MERPASIVSVDGATTVVEIDPEAACQRCAAGRGCGQGGLLGLGRRKAPLRMAIPRTFDHQVGGRVAVRLDPAPLNRAATTVYGLALLGLLVGVGAGQTLQGDAAAALLGAGGSMAGLLLARALARPCALQAGASRFPGHGP